MANPNPNTSGLRPIQPGEVRNPNGYSKKRRITDRLVRLLEDENLDRTVAITLFAAAIGDEKLLNGRKPNASFMQMLLDRVEGKVADRLEVEQKTETTIVELPPKDADAEDSGPAGPADAVPGVEC